ncbi:MAG: hypothetical protein OXQ31_12335 [Spirochaetaceae bacterium]|nr:hypothetical protein [Spirochaetaceae bacterium]
MIEYVICISNQGNEASLVVGRVYRRLPEARAVDEKLLRVIDEDRSEPDGYLYPASMFAPVELPEEARRALTAAGI